MGRGRAKAKQTKVARELKYSSPTTDYDALQRELAGGSNGNGSTHAHATADSDLDEADEPDTDDVYDDRWSSSR